MRRYIISFIILAIFYPVRSQHTVISATKMNILYCDISNPIDICVSNIPCSDLKVSASRGTFEKTDSCSYTILLDRPGNCYIKVHDSNGVVLDSKEFRVQLLPKPEVFFHYRVDENNRPAGQMGLSAELVNMDIDIRYELISYSVYWVRGVDTLKSTTCDHYRICDSAKEYFKEMRKGDMIIFDDVKIIYPRTHVRLLDKYVYRFDE